MCINDVAVSDLKHYAASSQITVDLEEAFDKVNLGQMRNMI